MTTPVRYLGRSRVNCGPVSAGASPLSRSEVDLAPRELGALEAREVGCPLGAALVADEVDGLVVGEDGCRRAVGG